MPPQPEDRASEGAGIPSARAGGAGRRPVRVEYAALNARLTLLGTVAGFVASVPGVILLKAAGAPAVLIFTTFVFAGAAVAGLRLPVPRAARRRRPGPRGARAGATRTPAPPGGGTWGSERDRELASLQPIAHPEVLFGLTTMSLIRGLAGFLVFLLAFGLRREHAALWWYGLALGLSGVGGAGGPGRRGPGPPRAHRAADPAGLDLADRRGRPWGGASGGPCSPRSSWPCSSGWPGPWPSRRSTP